MKGPDMMSGLVVDDRKGRKNGRGFYTYADGERGGVDPTVYDVLGLGPRVPVSKADVTERLTMAFINEAALCLQEEILRSARDGDIGAVFGLGYPPFRGGPFFTIDQMGCRRRPVPSSRPSKIASANRFAPAHIIRGVRRLRQEVPKLALHSARAHMHDRAYVWRTRSLGQRAGIVSCSAITARSRSSASLIFGDVTL